MSPSNSTPSFTSADNLLETFVYERTLSEDSRTLVVYLLGTAIPEGTTSKERVPTIIKVEKTPYSPGEVESLTSSKEAWSRIETVTCNDIYSTSLAWFAPNRSNPDVQISSICPATEKHILKYSLQESRLVRETPQLYRSIVLPYIESLPRSTISWVYNILEGTAEAENVLFRDDDPENGFVLTPDLKWDQKTISSLYLLILTQDRSIRSLRDLKPHHLPLLQNIRTQSERVAMEKYGIEKGELRFFVHYQPTYYHFHVHIVHLNYINFNGITVGQAHLLDDIIDNLEIEQVDAIDDKKSVDVGNFYYEKKTFTYSLGKNHVLYKGLSEASLEDE